MTDFSIVPLLSWLLTLPIWAAEPGKGFLFEARQKHFVFDEEHYSIDLVFYNRLLHCYVLIDPKIGKLGYGDRGRMPALGK